MSVTVLVLVSVNDDEPMALAQYLEAKTRLLEGVGARIARRFSINEAVVGHRPARMALLIEYPSSTALREVVESPDYAYVKQFREQAFLEYGASIVSGHDDKQDSVHAVENKGL
jgi:uncharacterized protein (DUF1330 family)